MNTQLKAAQEDLAYFLKENPKYEKMQRDIEEKISLCDNYEEIELTIALMIKDSLSDLFHEMKSLKSFLEPKSNVIEFRGKK